MAKMLTTAGCRALKATSHRREVRDLGAQGLHLVIQPSGFRSWALRFRGRDGRPVKVTLGPLAHTAEGSESAPTVGQPLTLVAARALANEIHRQRAAGRDVVADQRSEKLRRATADATRSSTAFAVVARRFIEEHAMKNTRSWRENTARVLGLDYPADGGEPTVIPGSLADRWSSKSIGEVDDSDIYTAVTDSIRHGVPGLAVRRAGASDSRGRMVAAALSRLFSWAREHRMVATNVCAGMYKPRAPQSRDRVLSLSEIRWLWQAATQVGHPFGVIVKLLLLTGCRRDEINGMRRSELTEDLSTLSLPASRVKNKRPHVVPLAGMARDLIEGVPQLASTTLVFTTTGRTPPSGWSKATKQIAQLMLAAAREEAAEAGRDPKQVAIAPFRVHDIRRSTATHLIELGIAPPHVVEVILGHVSGHRAGVAGIYNRSEQLAERRAALEVWASRIQAVVSTEAAAEVVPISRGRRKA